MHLFCYKGVKELEHLNETEKLKSLLADFEVSRNRSLEFCAPRTTVLPGVQINFEQFQFALY